MPKGVEDIKLLIETWTRIGTLEELDSLRDQGKSRV
jgi:hypothetical protein